MPQEPRCARRDVVAFGEGRLRRPVDVLSSSPVQARRSERRVEAAPRAVVDDHRNDVLRQMDVRLAHPAQVRGERLGTGVEEILVDVEVDAPVRVRAEEQPAVIQRDGLGEVQLKRPRRAVRVVPVDDDELRTLHTPRQLRMDGVPVRAAVVVDHEPADTVRPVVPVAPVDQPLQLVVLLHGGERQRHVRARRHHARQTDLDVDPEFGEVDLQVHVRVVRRVDVGRAEDAEDGRAPRTPGRLFDDEPSSPARKPHGARVPEVEKRRTDTDHFLSVRRSEDVAEDRRRVAQRAGLVAYLVLGERALHARPGRYANRLWCVFRKDFRHAAPLSNRYVRHPPNAHPPNRLRDRVPRVVRLPARHRRDRRRGPRAACRTDAVRKRSGKVVATARVADDDILSDRGNCHALTGGCDVDILRRTAGAIKG